MGNKRSVRLIAVLLILVMFLGVCPTALLAQALSDVGEHWAKEAINLWTARGIVKGYEDGTFGPDRFITRAEFAALLNRTFGFTTVSPKEFPDVSDTAWYAEEVAKAAGAGYMEGYEDGSFRPDNNITRQEAALVFARIYNLEQIDESYDFSDFDSIPDWSRKAVVAVAKAGLMQGYPDGSFGPARNITRAETVSVLDRLVAEIFTEDGTYGDAGEATVINGNAIITAADVTLVNMHIKGNLLIAESVGDGTVVLDNVVVDGELDVRGGGPASVILENSKVVSLTVSKDGVRIVIRGSKVDEARVKSASTIEQDPDPEGIEVLIIEEIPAEGEVVLLGDYGNLTVKAVAGKIVVESGHVDEVVVDETATDVELVLGSEASVSNLVLNAPATVTGSGKIEKATVNASGAVIEPEPEEVELGEGVSAIIGGEEVVYVPEEDVPGAPPEPEEPVYIPVSRISVDPEELVLTVGETDRIRATVRPSSATNRRVRWSSSDETAVTVHSNGNITAVGPGKAVITATSAANSSIKDSCSVRVFPEYDITVGLREWSKDRTEPESWSIIDDWIVYLTKTEPNNNWYAWQGRKSETDMKATDAWKVETAVHITKALLARNGVRTSMWLNVVNEEGTTIDWAILQFKRENNENGWQYWLSAEGEWVDIGGMPVTEGVHELAIHFSAGEIVLLIDGKEVESYQLESTLTYVKEVILNSYSYGESYEVKWKVPEVRAWARVVNEDTEEGFYTIQDAIDEAGEGDVIQLRSIEGGFDGFRIDGKNKLTIRGLGEYETVIKPSALIATNTGHKYTDNMNAVIFINNSKDITVEGLQVKDNSLSPDAIVFWNASSGTIKDVAITGSSKLRGNQTGHGIAVDAGGGQTTELNVVNIDICGFNKNGIDVVDGNGKTDAPGTITVNVYGGTIKGVGETDVIGQNGIVFWDRGGGSLCGEIKDVVFENLHFSPDDVKACGILDYRTNNQMELTVDGCTFNNVEVARYPVLE
ncbi:MAG TPA: S-layer homology domain-containing protein [Armatimonadota bacterium]|nr:S-layer homology domain-containing protein [Armatimonadota bacterium]